MKKIAVLFLLSAICLCMTGCASMWYTREECLAIVKAKGMDLELSEPQVLAEKVRNPMFLVGAWWGEQNCTVMIVDHLTKALSTGGQQGSGWHGSGYDFRADGTFTTFTSVRKFLEGDDHTKYAREFGTWEMEGDVLVLRETIMSNGKIQCRNLEKRMNVLRLGHDAILFQFASRRDMQDATTERIRQCESSNQNSSIYGATQIIDVGYDRQNRKVECQFTPLKDDKDRGIMSVCVNSNSRYVRTAKPSMPLAATAPTSAPQPPRTSADDMTSRQTSHGSDPHYVFERFAWENTLQCGFEYRIDGECTLQMLSEIEREVCSYIRTRYLSMHPTTDASSIVVDARPSFDNGRVVGTGKVLTITLVGTNYDSNTRRGMISVRFNAEQYEMARVWVRRNIETLARDKNILLTTGETPPPGSYISGDERIADTPNGKILEMEFKVE